ncbi:hypothetical protein [Moorena sp. SIO4A1]|nr:hypothetical protein [Moorena sp. SIO4A1]
MYPKRWLELVRSPHCNLGQRPRYANDERVGVCHLINGKLLMVNG